MENYGYSLEDLIPIVAELSSKYTGYDHIPKVPNADVSSSVLYWHI